MSKTGGSIVNMLADMWGGMPGMGHSGAARSGMENFTRTAAVEWGHAGVRVNAVAPGGTDAPPRRIPRNAAAQSEEERRWYRQ
ncbi:SDR family oxidoreductase, partial [Klebsiella pneumoniae]